MSHSIPSYYRYVKSITITNAGSGYDSANPPTLTISGGGGTGATATCEVVGGEISSVTVTNIGNGYTTTPTVVVSGSGGAVLTPQLSFATGPSTEYTHTNSANVKYSLPEFVQQDYTTFVSFIEKYYQWMEQENNPINILLNKKYNNIDFATDAELEKWRLFLARRWPQSIGVDKKFFYKRIKDIYESKGTKSSVEAFFRLFFAEDVDVLYPSKYVLKASDGIWTERQSVKVFAANDYEVLNLQGSLVDIHYYTTTGSVTKSEKIQASVTDVLKLSYTSPQQYEVFLNFDTLRSTIPGPGADGSASIVYEGPIATVNNVGAADASRSSAGSPYTITSSDWTSDGDGTDATFTVVVDGSGDASITVVNAGTDFIIGETITIADSDLGGGGGADLTFDVATLVNHSIMTVENVGSADASRTVGTYDITALDYTVSDDGSLAEFTITVDADGAATVTIVNGGKDFIVGETITIADSDLGGGGGADLTFDVATVGHRIKTILLLDGGQDYTAAPVVTVYDPSGGTGFVGRATVEEGSITKFTVTENGTGYTYTDTVLTLDTTSVRTHLTMRDQETTLAYLGRSLTNISAGTYSGADAGFKIGEVYVINELGDDAIGYALDYFLEDYVLIGGSNYAYGKITSVNSSNVPSTWNIVTPGYGFNKGSVTVDLTSKTNETVTVTITTGYLFSYPGQYIDDRGKLSDVNKIQDNRKYQNYSYIIKSSTPQSQWDRDVRNTIHPAGWDVFGELTITNELVFADINVDTPQFHIYFFEEDIFAGEGGDTSDAIAIEYVLVKADSSTVSDTVVKNVDKTVTDSTNEIDDAGDQTYFAEDYIDNDYYVREGGLIIELGKVVTDTTSNSDVIVPVLTWERSLSDSAIVSEQLSTQLSIQRSFTDSTSNTDQLGITINKSLSDSVRPTGNLNIAFSFLEHEGFAHDTDHTVDSVDTASINTSKAITDTGTTSEIVTKEFTTSRSDSATTSDSGSITVPQDYVDVTYFAEDYITGITVGTF